VPNVKAGLRERRRQEKKKGDLSYSGEEKKSPGRPLTGKKERFHLSPEKGEKLSGC